MIKCLYINICYGGRGIISHKDMAERQRYECSQDDMYFNSSLDSLKSDVDKIISLFQRNHSAYVQVGTFEISDGNVSTDNQKFYFVGTDSKTCRCTKVGRLPNIIDLSDKQMKFSEMKKEIVSYYIEICK